MDTFNQQPTLVDIKLSMQDIERQARGLYRARELGDLNQFQYEEEMLKLDYTMDEAEAFDPGRIEG